MSEKNIKDGIKHGLFQGCPSYNQVKDLKMRLCYGCQMGRMRAQWMKPVTGNKYDPLEYIAVDYKGPFSEHSVHHNTGFYLITDHESSAVWAYPCHNKGEEVLHTVLLTFLAYAAQEFPAFKIKTLHCDYDRVELGNRITTFLRERNVLLRASAPYAHHQNGLVERAVQKLLDKARTMLVTGRAPKIYWDYALLLAAHLINVTPAGRPART
eukprot:gene32761-biopygen27921